MKDPHDGKYVFNEFEIDVTGRVLRSGGRPVALNARAFDLLVELVRNRGEVVSKDRLLETVWAGQFVEENNLTVQISALRKAFGEAKGGQKYIATVPGRGYSFVAAARPDGDAPSAAAAARTPSGDAVFGRDREIGEIGELLGRAGANLVTLTGPGGSGKTRLARLAADIYGEQFAGGVFFVELAELRDPNGLFAVIEEKVRSSNDVGRSPKESLIGFFEERDALLVLDNFEQIIPAGSSVKELIAALPRLNVMVTSRSPLRLKDETEFAVRPLETPPVSDRTDADAMKKVAAVQLFAARAAEARPSFEVTGENAAAVGEICRRLDGLPLAIELAAGRAKLLSPESILKRMENSLALLAGGRSDVPDRQRTIRKAVEWSVELLDDDEKAVFRRLSVFAGGFTVEAAEAVLGEPERAPILDILTDLASNNLLATRDGIDPEPRLGMLQVIRDFAGEMLEASAETDRIAAKHAEYFVRLAEEAEPHLFSGGSVTWLSRLESDIDNLRAALRFAADHDTGTFVRLAGALRHFWIYRSHLSEGRRWLTQALDVSDGSDVGARFKLLQGLGIMARLQGDYDDALAAYEPALAESRAAGERRNIAMLCSGVGTVLQLKGDARAAKPYFEEGLAVSREIGDDYSIAYCLLCLGIVLGLEEKPAEARVVLEESLAILREFGSKDAISNNLNNLGAVAFDAGDFEAARVYFLEGLTLSEEVGNKVNITDAINGLAALAARDGKLEIAANLAGAADKLATSIGFNKEPGEQKFCDAYLADLRHALDEKAFANYFAAGRSLDRSEAVKLACGSKADLLFTETEIVVERHSISRVTIEEES